MMLMITMDPMGRILSICISDVSDKLTWFSNESSNHAREMKFGSTDGGEDGKHKHVGSVEIFKISTAQCMFFFEIEPFDKVYLNKACMTS